MLTEVNLKNWGPIAQLNWKNLGPINLIIGKNGAGKTFILKALYAALRTLETFKRGNEPRSLNDILAEKLYWTFQAEKIGDLVRKGASEGLSLRLDSSESQFEFSFGKDTNKQIQNADSSFLPRSANSIFLPAKEVLSLLQIILKSRDQDKVFGFDDTYVDLARALQNLPQQGKNYAHFSQARQGLEQILGGKVEYDQRNAQWYFKQGNTKFPIGITAEGIKKIAILDTLLGNRYLSPQSLLFIDEPESALHPEAISQFLEMVAILAQSGIQVFLASHSYFVIKKLYLIAHQKNMSIPVIASEKNAWCMYNLRDEMPENEIVNESIRLYEQELDLTMYV
jgi:AAA15 family ATPase/GTPase